jgi:ATP-dependent DNA ligase
LKRKFSPGFIVPTQPVEREKPPTGPGWVHEIKHDGDRLLVRREGASVQLFTRKANTWTERLDHLLRRFIHVQIGSPPVTAPLPWNKSE